MNALELRIPPVLLVVACALLMVMLSVAIPALQVAWPGGIAGGVLILVGAAVTVAGVLAFRKARTTVNPMHPEASTAVVSGGIYHFSRNPMYLGFLLALAGWAMVLGSLAALVVLPLYVAYMNRFQIVPEERALRQKFGAPYEAYMRQVRRWI